MQQVRSGIQVADVKETPDQIQDDAKVAIPNMLYWALKYSSKPTDESEIQKIDMTPLFYQDIMHFFKNNDVVRVGIKGIVRGGKSTEGIALAQSLFRMGQECGTIDGRKRFTINNVLRSQHEYDKVIRNPEVSNTLMLVDEFAQADETGENITLLQAIRKQMFDVQAARYIHTISLSPDTLIDDSINVILEVVQADKEKMITRNWLYYNLHKGGAQYMQLLGYVDVYVGDLIAVFKRNNMEKLFYKENKSSEELAKIQEIRKIDLYTDYMYRKFEKMDIMNKEKIYREREMDYAECALAVIDDLKPFCQLGMVTTKVIDSYVRIHTRRLDLPQTILGSKLMNDRIEGTIQMWEAYYKMTAKINKLDASKHEMEQTDYELRRAKLELMCEKLHDGAIAVTDYFKNLVEVKKRYDKEGQKPAPEQQLLKSLGQRTTIDARTQADQKGETHECD